MKLLQAFSEASFAAVVAFLTAVAFLVCAVTFYIVRWTDARQHAAMIDKLATRNVKLTLALERVIRRHDFMCPHPGETCEESGCLTSVDEARKLLNEDVLVMLRDELAK